MKKFQLAATVVFALLFFSCLGQNREVNNSSSDPTLGSDSDSSSSVASFLGDDAKTHGFRDAKTGLTVFSIDYPSSWKVVSKPTYISDRDFPFFQYRIQGPNGLKAFNGPSNNYISYSNPQIEQISRMNGTKNIRPLISMQQLIQQDIEPRMQNQGFAYNETIALPALERFF